MNAIERIDQALEQWAQNLRGGASTNQNDGLQPRDVLHRVLAALEDNRVEGLDHKIYAPNQYTIELNFTDEERQRLMPFLGREEMEGAIQRYCQEHKYNLRGPLEVHIMTGSSPAAYVPHRELNADQTYAGAPVVENTPAGVKSAANSSVSERVRVRATYHVTDDPAENMQPVTREPITQ